MISSVGSIIPNNIWKNKKCSKPPTSTITIVNGIYHWFIRFDGFYLQQYAKLVNWVLRFLIDIYIDTVTWFRVHFLKSKLANISVITMVYGRYDLTTTSWGIILDLWQLTMGKKWKWSIASLLTFIQLLCISFDFVPWYVDEQRDSMSLLGMGGDAKNHMFCPTKHLGKLRKSYLTENLKEQKNTFLGHRSGRIITLKQIIVWMIFRAPGQIKK